MRKTLLATFAAIFTLIAGIAYAADFKVGSIVISDPWARASASKMMKAGAAFLELSTHGAEMDRLVAAASPVSKKTELHTHLMEKGVMKMRQVEAIEIHPGTPTVLKPGGLHVMFMGLHAPLKEGQEIPITLTFEKAGQVEITAKVMKPGAKGSSHGGGMQHKHGS
ncbi:MAG: copper chaperone PCu(A)C [Rhodospirillales bacterium]|nr:copper chaperone PCu(A)C [Rhodospirillales bacterium]